MTTTTLTIDYNRKGSPKGRDSKALVPEPRNGREAHLPVDPIFFNGGKPMTTSEERQMTLEIPEE